MYIHMRGGAVCIYFSKYANLQVTSLSFDKCSIEALFLKLCDRYVTFLLGCLYRSPSSSIDNDKILVDFIINVSSTYEKSFIFGDFNMPDIS